MEELGVPLVEGGLLNHPLKLTLDVLCAKRARAEWLAEQAEQARPHQDAPELPPVDDGVPSEAELGF